MREDRRRAATTGLRGTITVLGAACLLACAAACATVPMADTQANSAAKQFQPATGTASVYLCRQSNGFGDTLDARVRLDGQTTAVLAPNTFQMLSVTPGHHTLSVTGPTNSEQVDLDAVAGNVYFYNVSIKWAGPMIRHRHIEAMTDADGRAAVAADGRAATMAHPN